MKEQENIKHALSYIVKEMDDRSSLMINDDKSFAIIVKKDEKMDKNNLFPVGLSLFKQPEVVTTILKAFIDMVKEEEDSIEGKFDSLTLSMPFGRAFEFIEARARCLACRSSNKCPKFEDDCELHHRIEKILDEAKEVSKDFIKTVND